MRKEKQPFTIQLSRTVVHEGTIQVWATSKEKALEMGRDLLDDDSPEIIWEAVEDNREVDGALAN